MAYSTGATDTYRGMSCGLGGTQTRKGEGDNLQMLSVYLMFRFAYSQTKIIMSQMPLHTYLPTHPPTHAPTHPLTYLPTYLSIYLWYYGPLAGPWPLFQFLNPIHCR
jgi:hypothetical protein